MIEKLFIKVFFCYNHISYTRSFNMQDNTDNEPLDRLETEASELVFDLMHIIEDFTQTYFNDEYEVLKFNINFLESNGFAYQKKVDYMKLNRFIAAAYNTIGANDVQAIDGLISKFYKDIVFLNNFYKSFLEKSKDISIVFKYHFLKSVGELDGLHTRLSEKEAKRTGKMEHLQNDEERAEFGAYIKEQFFREFKKERDGYAENLRSIINTKTYYFDKLLWNEAKKSASIRDFFKKSRRIDGDLTEELSTKIFVKQYLQTVDFSHAKDIKWHTYLQNVLPLMD